MAQESRQWYENSSYEADLPPEEAPTGRFSGEEIEFESFMFDGGQGIGIDLSRSGPLGGNANAVASAPTIAPVASPSQSPFMGIEAPRQVESGPPGSLRNSAGSVQAALHDSEPLASSHSNGASPFAGSASSPPSGPLRHTGPLVDGRTSSPSSGPLYQTGPLAWSGAVSPGSTGPLNQQNTGPLYQDTVGRAQTGPLYQNGTYGTNGVAANPQQSRLSGLLQQHGQTGPLSARSMGGGATTGPLFTPSRFMQSGPLTPADMPGEPSAALQPIAEQPMPAVNMPAAFSAPVPTDIPVPAPMPTAPVKRAWSDSTLAAVEDFSSVLITMKRFKGHTTTGSLSADKMVDMEMRAPQPQQDSGALYSNAVPEIRDTGSQYSEVSTSGASTAPPTHDALSVDPVSWREEPPAEAWGQMPSMPITPVMPVIDADEQSLHEEARADMLDLNIGVQQFEAPTQETLAPTDVSNSGFSGEAIEFEPFMFDGGTGNVNSSGMPELPHIEEFMPAVSAMEEALMPSQPAPPAQDSAPAPTQAMDAGMQPRSNDALPFWLQNTGNLSSQPLASYTPVVEYSQPVATPHAEVAPMMDVLPATDDSEHNIYANLPPIDPFDFTSLNLEIEDEALGFNTEELSGHARSNFDPMTATADLQAVASILGTDPDLETMDSAPLRPQMASVEAAPPVESGTSPESQADHQPADTAQLSTPATQQLNAQPRSWTATVTSNLSMDTITNLQAGTASLDDAAAGTQIEGLDADVAPFDFSDLNLGDAESPTGYLDYKTLRTTGPLGARSSSTVQLEAIAADDMPYSIPEPTQQDRSEAAGQGTPANARKWATSWLGDSTAQPAQAVEIPSQGDPKSEPKQPLEAKSKWKQARKVKPRRTPATKTPASVEEELESEAKFSQSPDAIEDAESDDNNPILSHMRSEKLRTGTLQLPDDGDDDGYETEGEQESVAPTEIEREPSFNLVADDTTYDSGEPAAKAGMERDEYVEPTGVDVMQAQGTEKEVLSGDGMQSQPEQVETPTSSDTVSAANSPYAYQPMQPQAPQAYAKTQPDRYDRPAVFPTSVLASGPLPSLDGFDDLQALVVQNPNDVGAHMALAAAYAQVGDVDTELRVYRRVLRRPNISDMILRLIAEELSDYEADLTGHAHFHQVRGDLYMKQNRYQEAIGEYNKIV